MESKDTGKVEETKKEEKQKEFVHPDTGEKISKSQYKAIMKAKEKAEKDAKKELELEKAETLKSQAKEGSLTA